MSYATVSRCATTDAPFVSRIDACIAQEQLSRGDDPNPSVLTVMMSWAVASASDVEAAYASAIAANNPNPGGDPSVITDGMILSHVQANWPAAP